MNAYMSRLSAKYWKRLPLATPARRAMTFRLPPENPCAPNSASAAAITAARRAGSTRAHVTVGMVPPSVDDHWSFYGDPGHSQVASGRRACGQPHHWARACGQPHTRRGSPRAASRPHLVGPVEREHVVVPDLLITHRVVRRTTDHPHRETGLLVGRGGLVVQLDGVTVEVADQHRENLVDQRLVHSGQRGLLED